MIEPPAFLPWLCDVALHGLDAHWFGQLRALLLAEARGLTLDLGAGTGSNFPHYPAGVRVIALEPDGPRLSVAAARRAGHARLALGVGEQLPLATASFDTVVCTMVLCSVTNPTLTLAECRRVLRPGGQLLFLEHVRAPTSGLAAGSLDLIQPLWGRCTGGCHVNRDTAMHIRAAGFAVTYSHRFRIPFWPARHWLLGRARPHP